MRVMSSMPALKQNASWDFLLCPDCGKVETALREAKDEQGTTAPEEHS
jgi:hypothetical protein